jgi:hypothetical protein
MVRASGVKVISGVDSDVVMLASLKVTYLAENSH